jgi:hypothetical protein
MLVSSVCKEASACVVFSQRPLSVRFRRVPPFTASLIKGRKSEPDPKLTWGAVQRRKSRRHTSKTLELICAGPVVRALVDPPPMRNRSAHVAQNVLPETTNCTTTASKAGSAILTHRLVTQDRNSAISQSCPKLRGELLGRRALANKKMVNRVGRHECGVTLWQI